jgi:hypothetical protein
MFAIGDENPEVVGTTASDQTIKLVTIDGWIPER